MAGGMARSGVMPPKQKPGRSKQDYGTPREFLDAVERRFGKTAWDLAAQQDNCVVPDYLGPGSGAFTDSLTTNWAALPHGVNEILWLNPPYRKITPWVKKAYEYSRSGQARAAVCMLLPASVGARWYWGWVHDYAEVLVLTPRLTFVGAEHPYPKDLMLVKYALGGLVDFARWDWTK